MDWHGCSVAAQPCGLWGGDGVSRVDEVEEGSGDQVVEVGGVDCGAEGGAGGDRVEGAAGALFAQGDDAVGEGGAVEAVAEKAGGGGGGTGTGMGPCPGPPGGAVPGSARDLGGRG